MGHERLGVLPKSKRWRDIVDSIAAFTGTSSQACEIASNTTINVQSRFRIMEKDSGVQAAFQFLVTLAGVSLGADRERELEKLGVRIEGGLTPLSLAAAVNRWVAKNMDSVEYARFSQSAVADAIAHWCRRQNTGQQHFFEPDQSGLDTWRGAGTGAGFCELARSFFAHLTRRYLSYFLEREASSAAKSIELRDRFQEALSQHIADVSKHAFETARITQSFAAGWFNKHARSGQPDREAIGRFVVKSLGKLREELLRESK